MFFGCNNPDCWADTAISIWGITGVFIILIIIIYSVMKR